MVTPETYESGWVQEEYHQMMMQKQAERDFTIIPVIVGREVPDVPFLSDTLWVDFRPPHTYREAFYRLLCAIHKRRPGPEVDLPGELLLPPVLHEEATLQPHQGEITFVERLFELLYAKQAVLLFAQADRGHSAMKSYLLERAEQQFGQANVVHMVPPCSPHTESEEFFAVLG